MPLFPPQGYRKTEWTHRRGLAADKPLAADVLPGTLYFSTDTLLLERSTGVAWESYSVSGSSGPTGVTGPAGMPGLDGEMGEEWFIVPQSLSGPIGILPVVNGGTGVNDIPINRIPFGNGTSPVQTDADLTFDGNELIIGSGFPQFRVNISSGGVTYRTSADDIYEFGGITPAGMYLKFARGTNDAIGTQHTLYKNRLGGAVSNNDVLGDLAFNGFTDAEYQLGVIRNTILDATPTSEDTSFQFYHASAGALVNILNTFAPGIVDLPQGQLRFPSTQNPSADANTFDDYEEGTWTPTFGGSGGQTGQTYSTQNAYYTKAGGLVWVTANIALTALGTITGTVQIQGLPFAPTADGSATWALFANLTSAMTGLGGFMSGGGASIMALMHTAGIGGTNILFPVQADFSNTTQVFIGCTYRAD